MRKLCLSAAIVVTSLVAATASNAAPFYSSQPLARSGYQAVDDVTMTVNKNVAVAVAPRGNSTGVVLNAGTKVTVIGKTDGEWTHIQANGINGYVPTGALTQSTSTDMQILADKVKADKKALVAQNMELTEAEAKSFWPIYDAYQQDLQKINNRLAQTIVAYADAYNKGALDNAAAKKLLGEALAIQKSELKLQETYVPKLEKVLPEVKVARYIQIESKIRALVRYALADKIPLVK
jgi:uncharacterized protein YgiM (DUF1202 family)